MEKSDILSGFFLFGTFIVISSLITLKNKICMKKQNKGWLFLLLLIFSIFEGVSQERKEAFQSGEWMKFRVRYGIFNASYATLQLKETVRNGEKVYHAVGKGQTTGLARLFFKVDDTYESYFGKLDEKPRFFIRDIYEGGYTKKLNISFDHNKQQATIKDLEKNEEAIMDTPLGIQDIISAFYWLRDRPELENIKEGEEIVIDMLFDDDEIFKFKLRFLGKENIKTKFGKINTLMFRPLVQDGRVFKEQESLTVWITDDENRIPVQVRASLRVGSLWAELDDFGGLKHETTMKK
ncbi:ATP-dependent exonuclease [Capnocytophaga canimorsus]|nr:ATP-dependent exonuclease [Capnocytophaga canimorsus]